MTKQKAQTDPLSWLFPRLEQRGQPLAPRWTFARRLAINVALGLAIILVSLVVGMLVVVLVGVQWGRGPAIFAAMLNVVAFDFFFVPPRLSLAIADIEYLVTFGVMLLVGIVIGFIALIAIRTGFNLYIDIAIALGLVGFLSTVAFARFIMPRVTDAAKDPATSGKTRVQRRKR